MGTATNLRTLLEVSLRQEQLLSKVCGVLEAMDAKADRLAESQERLEATMQQYIASGPSGGADPNAGRQRTDSRGSLTQPPGRGSAGPGYPAAGGGGTGSF